MPNYIKSVGTGLGEDPTLVHVPGDRRGVLGARVAAYIDTQMRDEAWQASLLTPDSVPYDKKLCPGCYMAVVVNALIKLAADNGQPLEFVRTYVSQALWDVNRWGKTLSDINAAEDAFTGAGKAVRAQVGFTVATTPGTPEKPSRELAEAWGKYQDDFWLAWTPGDGDPMTLSEFRAATPPQHGYTIVPEFGKATLEGPVSRYDQYLLEGGSDPAPGYRDLDEKASLAKLRETLGPGLVRTDAEIAAQRRANWHAAAAVLNAEISPALRKQAAARDAIWPEGGTEHFGHGK